MKAAAYSDGRGNTSTGSCAAVIVFEDGQIWESARLLGDVTSNYAEYKGILLALNTAHELGVRSLEIYSDSQLVVNHVNCIYECRNETLKGLLDEVWNIANSFDVVSLNWIPRTNNVHADSLCRTIAYMEGVVAFSKPYGPG